MSYEAICTAIGTDGEGIYNFGQSRFLRLVADNQAGICRGLCTAWLCAKKSNNDYLREIVSPTMTTGLLHEDRTAMQASNFQTEYINVSGDSADAPSAATLSKLRGASIGTVGEKRAEAYQGFSAAGTVLAQLVLTSGCRFFILSIKGTLGGHSVAFHRPWVFFGKSSSCFFFDPNFGEFKLNNQPGIEKCLNAVATAYNHGLSTGYRLWGFR